MACIAITLGFQTNLYFFYHLLYIFIRNASCGFWGEMLKASQPRQTTEFTQKERQFLFLYSYWYTDVYFNSALEKAQGFTWGISFGTNSAVRLQSFAKEENTAILMCSLVFSAGITLTRLPGAIKRRNSGTHFVSERTSKLSGGDPALTHSQWLRWHGCVLLSRREELAYSGDPLLQHITNDMFIFTLFFIEQIDAWFSLTQNDIFFISPDCQTCASVQVKPDQTET